VALLIVEHTSSCLFYREFDVTRSCFSTGMIDYLLRGSVPICAVRCTALQRAHLNFDCKRGAAVNVWLWLKTALGILTALLCFVGEVYTEFCWGNLRVRDHLEDPGVDGRIILRWIFRKWDVGLWTGSSWLRKGTGGGHL